MCPLVGSPNRGYADYQRVGNWDSGVIWHLPATSFPAQVQSPMMDVSRYGYIIGQLGLNSGVCEVIWDWYNDSSGITLLCERRYTMASLVGPYQQLHLVAAGPYCQVTLDALGGVNADAFANMVASNRVHPLEFIPSNPVLIDQQGVAVGAGATAILYPDDYYAGPIQATTSVSQAGGVLELDFLSTINTWDTFVAIGLATNTTQIFTYLVPPGAWRARVINTAGAAGVYSLTIVPSLTGAT